MTPLIFPIVRRLTHVLDIVGGTILAMESPYADGEILNIASRDTVSIINLAYLIGYEPAVALTAGLRETILWQAQCLG